MKEILLEQRWEFVTSAIPLAYDIAFREVLENIASALRLTVGNTREENQTFHKSAVKSLNPDIT
jgi:hypothetical protein